jgi:hypothetical protein
LLISEVSECDNIEGIERAPEWEESRIW